MLCNLLLVLTRVLTLFNGDMWYVIRGYEGGFNLLAWCWNPPMVVVTVQGAPDTVQYGLGNGTLLCNQPANPTHSAQLNHDTPFTKDLRQRRSFPYHTTLAAERTPFHDVPPSLKEVPTDDT